VDLEEEAKGFGRIGKVERNAFLFRFYIDEFIIVLFKNGRVLVQGTQDIITAKSLYAKYIGH
jgi:hypothetical protein